MGNMIMINFRYQVDAKIERVSEVDLQLRNILVLNETTTSASIEERNV